MLHVPCANKFLFEAGTFSGRPSDGAMGVQVTPGTGSYGSYVEVISDTLITEDCYGIAICISQAATSTTARRRLVDIGIDPAGGTSYSSVIPDLLCTNASPYGNSTLIGGVWYYFPIFIKAGSAIAARACGNGAQTLYVAAQVYGKPTAPEMLKVGSKVISYGVTVANPPTGVSVTPGTTNRGAWVSLGTVAAGDKPFFWQFGVDSSLTSLGTETFACDIGIGDATNKALVISAAQFRETTAEQMAKPQHYDGYYQAAPGDIVYGRMQDSQSNALSHTMGAYGVIP